MTIDVKRALVFLDLLDPANKYETMLQTAAILTKLEDGFPNYYV